MVELDPSNFNLCIQWSFKYEHTMPASMKVHGVACLLLGLVATHIEGRIPRGVVTNSSAITQQVPLHLLRFMGPLVGAAEGKDTITVVFNRAVRALHAVVYPRTGRVDTLRV